MHSFLGVDIGGTKTLLAVFSNSGTVKETLKFPTPKKYDDFLKVLQENIAKLQQTEFTASAVAVPGKVNRKEGIVVAMGNLPWTNEHIIKDIERIIHCPVVIENDAKLATLSEAKLIINEYKKVLYVTISTGINAGLAINGVIDSTFSDSESGHMLLYHNGKLNTWESFASGRSIVETYGKQAREITDEKTWRSIAHNIAIGMIDLIAIIQPEIILLGGGVGAHFDKFKKYLTSELKSYEMPLVPIPPIQMAQRPEEAVIYGCYDLIRSTYAHLSS